MRLKTKLVLWLTALMFAIVLLLSSLFVGELLRQRIEQTAATNAVLAHEGRLLTRSASLAASVSGPTPNAGSMPVA